MLTQLRIGFGAAGQDKDDKLRCCSTLHCTRLQCRAVLVELLSLAAKYRAFRTSSRLRSAKIRLDDDLTRGPKLWKEMQERKALSRESMHLKTKGCFPVFRRTIPKCRDDGLVRKCVLGVGQAVAAQLACLVAIANEKGLHTVPKGKNSKIQPCHGADYMSIVYSSWPLITQH